MPEPETELPPRIPKILGTQIGLSNPRQIDQIKVDMVGGRFDYVASRVSGLRLPSGTYYVRDGHHRIVAAMEIYKETGNPEMLLKLVNLRKWDPVLHPPNDAAPLPSRSWWAKLRDWLRP